MDTAHRNIEALKNPQQREDWMKIVATNGTTHDKKGSRLLRPGHDDS